MITLEFKHRHCKLTEGEVIHLKVISLDTASKGRWHLVVEDVTPEDITTPWQQIVVEYVCLCGARGKPNPDGSIPDGWRYKEDGKKKYLVCPRCRAR